MKYTATRRDALAIVGGTAAAIAVAGIVSDGATPQPTSSLGQYEADITNEDRLFRFVFNRTLFRLRLRGKITRQQFRDFRAASFSTFEYRHNGKSGAFIQHVRRDVNKASNGAVTIAAGMLFEALIRWIITNWNSIVQFVTGNLDELNVAIDEDAPEWDDGM